MMAAWRMEGSTEASSEVPYKRHAGAHAMRQLVSAMLLLSALAVCALLASDGGNFSVSRTNDLAQEDWRLRAVKVFLSLFLPALPLLCLGLLLRFVSSKGAIISSVFVC